MPYYNFYMYNNHIHCLVDSNLFHILITKTSFSLFTIPLFSINNKDTFLNKYNKYGYKGIEARSIRKVQTRIL